jgi:hypothetical protein
MCHEELLRRSFISLEVNDDFSEAVLGMRDGSRLRFCHRVGERWAKAEGDPADLAGQVLATLSRFRLNGKHLDVQFGDGSRWEARFGGGNTGFPSAG